MGRKANCTYSDTILNVDRLLSSLFPFSMLNDNIFK